MDINSFISNNTHFTASTGATVVNNTGSNNTIFIIVAAVVVVIIGICVFFGIRLRSKKKKKAIDTKGSDVVLEDINIQNQLQPGVPMDNGISSPNGANMSQQSPIPQPMAMQNNFSKQPAYNITNNNGAIAPEIVAVIAAAVAASEGKQVGELDIQSIEKAPELPQSRATKMSFEQASNFVTSPPTQREPVPNSNAPSYNAWGTAAIQDYTEPF